MERMVVYMGDHTVFTKLVHGPKIYVDSRETSISSHLIMDGLWENWVTQQFLAVIKPGMTVLDIGANCGYYSLLAAHFVGKTGIVHAFEPNPFHYENFMKSKSVNGFSNLHLHRVALNDRPRELTLYVPTRESGGASIHKDVHALLGLEDETICLTVPAVRLPEYLPGIKVDLIKIDIEGAEPVIMDSIFEMIRNNDKLQIILEYNPEIWSHYEYDSKEILERFVRHGFQVHVIHHDASLSLMSVDMLMNSVPEGSHFDLYLSNF